MGLLKTKTERFTARGSCPGQVFRISPAGGLGTSPGSHLTGCPGPHLAAEAPAPAQWSPEAAGLAWRPALQLPRRPASPATRGSFSPPHHGRPLPGVLRPPSRDSLPELSVASFARPPSWRASPEGPTPVRPTGASGRRPQHRAGAALAGLGRTQAGVRNGSDPLPPGVGAPHPPPTPETKPGPAWGRGGKKSLGGPSCPAPIQMLMSSSREGAGCGGKGGTGGGLGP